MKYVCMNEYGVYVCIPVFSFQGLQWKVCRHMIWCSWLFTCVFFRGFSGKQVHMIKYGSGCLHVFMCFFFTAFSGKYVHMNEYGVFTCVVHGVYMCLRVFFFQGLQWEVRPYERVWCVYVCHSWCLHVFTCVVFSGPSVGSTSI